MAIRELQSMKEYNIFHGHKNEKFKLYKPDNWMLSYIGNIIDIKIPSVEEKDFSVISESKMKEKARAFFNGKIELRNIGFLSDERLKELLSENDFENVQDLAAFFNSSSISVTPLLLPIDPCYDDLMDAITDLQLVYTLEKKYRMELLSKIKVFFNKICLSKTITDIALSSYVHEIMHTQQEKNKGVIEDYYNSEVLSIFMELLCSFENSREHYNYVFDKRIEAMLWSLHGIVLFDKGTPLEGFNKFNYAKAGKYLVSTAKAFNLFNIYLKGDPKTKKEILTKIQYVIDNRRSLEETLEKFDVSYENSLDYHIPLNLVLR